MSECRMARNGTAKVRPLPRALYRASKQDKERRFDRRYDKVWRPDILWEAWRQGKANKGAPGVDGKTIEESGEAGQEAGMIEQLQEALRAHRDRFAPVRGGESPTPQGGPRPRGSATGADRVVQTAMQLVLEPIFEADLHDCSYGYRPKRDAKQASVAIREALDTQAWGGGEIDCQAYFPSSPHGKLMQLITKRSADGSMLKLIKQPLTVGLKDQKQMVPTTVGVPPGAPISPLSSNISLPLLDHLWHRRGYPAKCGATLHRSADDAMVVCRRSPQPALAACEAIATRMEVTLNRAKTRVTRLTDGLDFSGFQFVTRKSPKSGKHTSDLCPAKSAQQKIRNRLQYLPSRRAPIRPTACVEMVNPLVLGGVHYFRHTNASQAVRGLQRFVNLRFRRYLTPRSKGRGFGGQRFPNSTLYALGLVYIGSGMLEDVAKPVHGGRCSLSDRRTREN